MRILHLGAAMAAASMGAVAELAQMRLPADLGSGRPDHSQPTRPKRPGTFKQKARQQIAANAKKKARRR